MSVHVCVVCVSNDPASYNYTHCTVQYTTYYTVYTVSYSSLKYGVVNKSSCENHSDRSYVVIREVLTRSGT